MTSYEFFLTDSLEKVLPDRRPKAADPGEKLNNTDLLHDRAPLDRGEKSIKTKADCAALVFRYKMSSNCLPI